MSAALVRRGSCLGSVSIRRAPGLFTATAAGSTELSRRLLAAAATIAAAPEVGRCKGQNLQLQQRRRCRGHRVPIQWGRSRLSGVCKDGRLATGVRAAWFATGPRCRLPVAAFRCRWRPTAAARSAAAASRVHWHDSASASASAAATTRHDAGLRTTNILTTLGADTTTCALGCKRPIRWSADTRLGWIAPFAPRSDHRESRVHRVPGTGAAIGASTWTPTTARHGGRRATHSAVGHRGCARARQPSGTGSTTWRQQQTPVCQIGTTIQGNAASRVAPLLAASAASSLIATATAGANAAAELWNGVCWDRPSCTTGLAPGSASTGRRAHGSRCCGSRSAQGCTSYCAATSRHSSQHRGANCSFSSCPRHRGPQRWRRSRR